MSDKNVPAMKNDTAPTTPGRPTLRSLLEGDLFREQLAKALPKHLTPERFVRVAVTAMNKTPKLANCDQASFFNALLTLSQIGLEPDGRRAHLIPFENKKRGIVECQLIVDYKGIVELIENTGEWVVKHSDVVCKNDIFEYDMGEIKKHSVDFQKERGPGYAAYVQFLHRPTGRIKTEILSKEEIYKARDSSSGWKAYKAGHVSFSPWDGPFEHEFWKKTALRRGSKWVKLSPEQRDLIEADDTPYEPIPEKSSAQILHERMAGSIAPQIEQSIAPQEDATEPITAEGLSGDKLALFEKVAEMAAGDMIETNAILKNLSGGKVCDKEGLIAAGDSVVKDMMKKAGVK